MCRATPPSGAPRSARASLRERPGTEMPHRSAGRVFRSWLVSIDDGKRGEAAQAEIGRASGPDVRIRRQAWHAGNHCAQRDLALEACQGMAEAVVDAVTKRQVMISVAADVEAIGIRKRAWIPVRGAEEEKQSLRGPDLLPTQLHILRGHAGPRLDGRVVAEAFLQRLRHEAGRGAQSRELFWMGHQRVQSVADELRGRLLSSNQQHLDDSE